MQHLRSDSQAPGWTTEGSAAQAVSKRGQPWDLPAPTVRLRTHPAWLYPFQVEQLLSCRLSTLSLISGHRKLLLYPVSGPQLTLSLNLDLGSSGLSLVFI